MSRSQPRNSEIFEFIVNSNFTTEATGQIEGNYNVMFKTTTAKTKLT